MDVSVKAWANSFNIFCNKASDVNCCEEQRVSTSIQHVKGEVGGGGGRERKHTVSKSLFNNIDRMLKQSARAFSEEKLEGSLESSLHAHKPKEQGGGKK